MTDIRQLVRILFFLITIFFSLSRSAFAEINQWDFQNTEDYHFDSQKMEVKDGVASLVSKKPFRDQGTETFDRGEYTAGTWAARGGVEMVPGTVYEMKRPGALVPLGTRQPGIMALWNLDEPSGTNLLDQVGRNIAKASDSEIVSGQPGFGYARRFDGVKSHVFIPHYQNLNWTGPFTVEAWVRPMSAGKNPQTLLSKWQAVGAQKGFAIQINPEGKIDFQVSKDGAITVHHFGESVLVAGNWYHIACVYTGQDLRVHVNGVLDGEPTPFQGPIHSPSNPIYIGALIDSRLTDFFEGVIDEVTFYNRALGEIETLTHFGNPEGLVALWHFNDRSGLIQDDAGYGHHGAPEGLPLYNAEGRLGGALHFEGVQSYAEVTESYHFGPKGEMTLEGWVKPDVLPGNGELVTLVTSRGDSSKGYYGIYLTGPDGRIRAFSTALTPDEAISSQALMPDIWQHVAVSWGGGSVRIYMNGILDNESAYQGLHLYGKSGLRFGMDTKKSAPLRGSLDEFAFFRRVRTAQEIANAAGLFPSSGSYTSEIKDANDISPWRSLTWGETMPYGTRLSKEAVGLLNLYSFDEVPSNLVLDEKGESALTAFGTHAVPGIFSSAQWFSNKGYDKLVSQKDLPPLSTFSVSLWFQFSNKIPGLNDRIFSIGDESPTAYRGPDGKIHAGLVNSKMILGNKSVADSQWHHLAFTADGRDLLLYVDGAFDGRTPFIGASAKAPLVIGNLKSTDTFQGAVDDLAFFNYAVSEEAIRKLYLNGKTELKFLVRSSNKDSFPDTPWRGPQGPSAIEMTPSVSTSALWHFNEKVITPADGDLKDAGKFANHLTAFGQVEPNAGGILENSIQLNGASDFLIAEDHESFRVADQLTLSAWVKPSEIFSEGAVILDKKLNQGSPAFSTFALEIIPANRLMLRLGYERGYHTVSTERDGEVAVGRWNHVAAVYNGREVKLFINGTLKKTASFNQHMISDPGPLYIGRYGSAPARFFGGSLDEVFMEARAFSDHEIEDLFHKANPENYFRDPGPHKLELESARYFQYRAFLSSEHALTGPTLEWVEVQSSVFPQDRPWVSNRVAVSFAQLDHFRERVGASHQGGISYQVSHDGANWYFHNGRRWVIANGSSESNTATQLEKRLRDFPQEVGIGSFYFKAFLHSLTGLDAAQLDAVEVEYLPNKLTLSIPNGGEAWTVGSDQIIEWKSAGEVTKVRLEYSKDDFKKDFHIIDRETTNLEKYTWKVPNEPATQVKIRVSDALDPRIYDTSDISFRISGSFKVVTPNWNERWLVGAEQDIRWQWNGRIENVKLDYSTDNFNEAIFPIVDSVKNEGRYKWALPDHISSTVKVRVSDVSDAQVFDASNDTFAIIGALELLRPKDGERWLVDSEQDMEWQTTGTIPRVKIEYILGEDQEWKLIAQEAINQNGFRWKVPDEIGDKTRIRVSDATDSKVFTQSRPFPIVGGIRLLNPKGGEKWTVASKRKIVWQTIGTLPNVKLEYAVLDPKSDLAMGRVDWKPLEEIAPNIGNYVWSIPDELSGQIAVRVSNPKDPQVEAVSVDPIEFIPGFVLTSPNGGENWGIGSELQITWRTIGSSENVRLEYSKDNFVKDVHEIIAEASNVGQYNWTLPDDPTTQAQVRISDSKRLEAQDISDAVFRIHGNFRVLTPKGNEKFQVASLATLEWETLGNIPKVKLEYSGDEFAKDGMVIAESIPNEGRMTWTVPDHLGSGYQIRITDVEDLLTSFISDAKFSIVGDFHLTQPLGGESFTVGTVVPITWKSSGSVPFVRIDYSEDNFEASFNTIAHEAPNNGAFGWTIPNRIGKQFKIRVWDPSDPDSMDIMTAPARIMGGFRLEVPNGGEILYTGEPFTLAWESFGLLQRVKLEFSDDNFNQHIWEITDTYENIGRYEWQVPDAVSGLYKIRISDPKDVSAFDISNSDFRIRTRVTVLTPNGYERWALHEKHPIRWQTSSSVQEVLLEFSNDDFASSVIINARAPNTGIYDWEIPDFVSQNVKVRVSDAKDSEAQDTSDIPFQILGILNVTSPGGGEVWKVGEQREISWNTAGKIEGVRLEYSRDDFASEAIPIMTSLANAGTFMWVVPDDISANIRVRVTDAKNPNTSAISPQPFQIAASFAMMSPNGGELWHATEKRELSWVTVGSVKEVDLFYSADHFQTDPMVIDRGILNTGKYMWDIPRILGENFYLRVCDSGFEGICDNSDQTFAIRSPFEIVFPRGGESWPVGSDQEIRWNTYGRVDRVIVEYGIENQWKILADELANGGQLLFRVPDEISNQILFRVRDYEDDTLFSLSKDFVRFTGTFTLLSPNGGEKWPVDSIQKISWDTIGTAPNIRLEYSDDDFNTSIHLMESVLPNTGSYEWKVPFHQGPLMKVRVMDVANPESMDISDAPFKIMAGFHVLEPQGGESWVVGTKHKIRWETFGNADRVALFYLSSPRKRGSMDPPVKPGDDTINSWTVIADNVRNSGEYEWQVPSMVSSEVRIRIQDTQDADAQDESDASFAIRPDVVVTQPNGAESVFVGRPYEIRWTEIGNLGRVRVEYSKDHFDQGIHLIKELEAGVNSVVWTPSDDITTTAQIRVTSLDSPEVSDVSDQVFPILPSLKLISPKGGENWTVGTEVPMTWDWRGSLDSVKIEYSNNDFASALTVTEKAPSTGTFTWQVPDTIASNIKVRVSDFHHPQAFVISEIPLKIIPGFNVVSPNGGELWPIGSTQEIKWDTAGTSSRVRLEYATTPTSEVGSQMTSPTSEVGVVWKSIAEGLRNQGTHSWVIPSDVSSHVKLRVVDALVPEALDESDADFKILGVFKLISPKAEENLFVQEKHQIQWETQGNVPSVKLEYFYDEIASGASHPRNDVPEGTAKDAVIARRPQADEAISIEPLWSNSGFYYWTVPDTITEQAKLRISDAQEPDAFLISPAPFKIRGKLEFDFPLDQIHWQVGSAQTLTWKTTGTIPRVSIAYALKPGQPWKTLVQDSVNTGSLGWLIPEETSPSVVLRIEDTSNPEVFDSSENPITIAGLFEFLSPAVGDVWKVGEERKIKWKTTGTMGRVHLSYASGKEWIPIAGPLLNEGSYTWKVPDDISSHVKIRIQNTEDEQTFAVSPDFSIQGALVWSEPAISDNFEVGTRQTLRWQTTGSIPWVRVELIQPATGEKLPLARELENKGSYEWTIPDFIQEGLQLKISDIRDASVTSATPAPISILGAFQLISPKPSEIWVAGAQQEIAWTNQGTIPTVILEYSRDDFYRDVNLITADLANTGSFVWEVPDAISKDLKIRISDARDPKAFSILEKPFEIKGSLKWRTPAGGEVWTVSNHQLLFWENSGSIPQVRLEYSRDDFGKDIQVIENKIENKGSYEWKIPDIISKTVKLRIADARDVSVFQITSPFEVRGALALNSPAGGEILQVLGETIVTWETTGTIPKVRLEYSSDDFSQDIQRIAANIENKGIWRWNVPDKIGKNFKVRISDDSNLAVSNTSPLPYEIRGSFSFVEPSLDQAWTVGSTQALRWNSVGTIPFVILEYSKDEFQYDIHPVQPRRLPPATYVVEVESIPNSGAFEWQVPDDISEKIRVRVKDASMPEVFAISQAKIKISGILEWVELEAGSILNVGESHFLRWNTTGSIPAVRLEYAVISNVGAGFPRPGEVTSPLPPTSPVWKLISGSAPNVGTFEWVIPDDITNSAQLRVTDIRDSTVQATSKQPFEIMGDFDFISPLGGERWIVGSDHEILWRSLGTVPEVKMEFSKDGFDKDTQIIAERILNSGRFSWNVPDLITDKGQLRISDVRYPQSNKISPQPFSIIGQIILMQPLSPITWKVGSEQKIVWQTSGTIPLVKLEYSLEGLSSPNASIGDPSSMDSRFRGNDRLPTSSTLFYQVIQDKVPNDGEFLWTLPDLITPDLRIRISDAKDARVYTETPRSLKVEGEFEWQLPKESQVWTVGDQIMLEWKTTGTIPIVTLDLSADGFQQDIIAMEPLLANEGKYHWNVPDLIQKGIKLRLRDARDENVFEISTPIEIMGALALKKPQGGEVFKVGDKVSVEWQTTGTLPTLRLEYAPPQPRRLPEATYEVEEEIVWQLINGSVPNTGVFEWVVPDAVSQNVWLRIVDASNPEVKSATEKSFKIIPAMEWVRPTEGEKWKVSSEQTLLWKTTGNVPLLGIEFSRDGFHNDRQVIATHLGNSGSYNWQIPDAIDGGASLRLFDGRDPSIFVDSPSFAIQGGLDFISLMQPEIWTVGESHKIEWQTTGTILEVKLEFSIDDFNQNVTPIYASVRNEGNILWQVPDAIGKNIKLRISDVRNPEVYSPTKGSIDIRGALAWMTPSQQEDWIVGKEYALEWKTTGTIPVVNLEYSSDEFQQDIRSLLELYPNTNRYLWQAEDLTHQDISFRIKDARDAEVFAVSVPVKVHGILELLAPEGGVKLHVGSQEVIQFKAVGTIPFVKVEYSRDGFQNDIQLIESQAKAEPAATSSYRWQVPDAISDKVWLRISDAQDPSVLAVSKEPFTIQGDFSMLLPKGDDVWTVGETREIAWRTFGSIPSVTLQYSSDGFQKDFHSIAESIPNQGLYSWQVADAIGNQIWIRVLDASNSNVWATHEAPIQIQGALRFKEFSPNTSFTVGSHATLEWETVGSIQTVQLEYQPLGGEQEQENAYQVIESTLRNPSSYAWEVPDLRATHVKFKITDVNNPAVFSELQNPVSLLGVLELIEPQGVKQWPVGSSQQILWKSQGYMPHVKLEYSRDQFASDYGVMIPMMDNTGTFEWKIPDVVTRNLQIRVSDAEHPEVFSVSSPTVEILGVLRLITPLGGEELEVGAKVEFQWSTQGSIPYVKIEYSKDPSFAIAVPMIERLENIGRYVWSVPDEPGEFWSRVSDAADARVSTMIQQPIKIKPGLVLTSPRGGEMWKVGEDHEITWQWLGKLPMVRLEYSTDDFQTKHSITPSLSNQGRFVWRVPDIVSDQIRVRVSDAQDESIASVQITPLKIRPIIFILSPREREFWRVGTKHSIRWQTQGSVPFFKLEYSADRFASATVIAGNLSGVTEYLWDVPDIGAQQIWFRVTSSIDSSVFSISETPMEIGGALKLKEPLGGEVYRVAEDIDIAWETFGTIPRIRLELSGDNFKNNIQEITSDAPNAGHYQWKVPDRIHPSLQIRVSDAIYPNIFSVSSPFKITGNIKLDQPKGGEIWQVGSRQILKWHTHGSIANIRVDFSNNDFASRNAVTDRLVNTGTLIWEIPDLAGENIKIRVSDADHEDIFDETEFDLEIRGVLEMISPEGPETWIVGTDQTIAWKTKGTLSNVHIDYSVDDFENAESIAENLANSGAFVWRVPDLKARNLKIRVMNAANTEIYDIAEAMITVQGRLMLTSPMGGEVWLVGTEHPMTWSTTGPIEKIRLDYWNDHSRSLLPIATSIPNTGQYPWKIPDTVSKRVFIRVSDAENAAILSEMTTPFEIRPVITLLSPMGGEIWEVGARHPISWKTQGSVPKVKIEYSPDEFVRTVEVITPELGNKGSYYWEVPAVIGNKAKVRVSSSQDPNVFDVSRNAFTVAGELELAFPTLGETFTVGERMEIRWSSSANIKSIKIEYSEDDFETSQIVSDAVSNTGKFLWTVPDKISEKLKLRISDSNHANVFSISKEPFRIKGALRFLSPRGGELLRVGSPFPIRWETMGHIPSIRLDYSGDNFKTAVPIEGSIHNTGSYEWVITNMIPERLKLRISDANDPSVQVILDKELRTVGQLLLISPKGGERWIVNEEHDIRWESIGDLSKIVLEYSKDNFTKDIHLIAASVPNLGRFVWRTPFDRSSDVRVRVRSAEDSEVFAVSEEPFKIDFYRVRWMIRDEITKEHLTGLILSDSGGKTQTGLSSPVTLEYPYGIFTAVWTKPGYSEFQSSWLADRDLTLAVMLKPAEKLLENVRADFHYDPETDVVRIKAWYEKEGKVVTTVIHCEVKIYEGAKLVQILDSSKPDPSGAFNFVWNTSMLAGDIRYLASASISTAAGRTLTSPLSYQINLPVKERKIPFVRTAIAPPAKKQTIVEEEQIQSLDEIVQETAASEYPKPIPTTPKVMAQEFELIVPDRAALNETVSIQYKGLASGMPLIDIYDSNKKLIVSGAHMGATSTPGLYTYLLPIKGVAFIAGKTVTVSVIEASTGRFKSAPMLIQTPMTALGFDQELAGREVSSYLHEIDQIIVRIRKSAESRDEQMPKILKQFEDLLDKFSVVLTEKNINRAFIDKLNKVAEEFAAIASTKGYDMRFLVEKPLGEESRPEQVYEKFRNLKNAVHMMIGLYSFHANRG